MYIITCEIDHMVQCMRQGAQDWNSGKTQRDGMGRDVGVGSGWGTHVYP